MCYLIQVLLASKQAGSIRDSVSDEVVKGVVLPPTPLAKTRLACRAFKPNDRNWIHFALDAALVEEATTVAPMDNAVNQRCVASRRE